MQRLLNDFVVLFVVVDPIGLVPLFIALTHDSDRAAQRRTALRGVSLAAAILLAFFLVGDRLLRVLAIGLPAFRIAGGALLFLLAIDMVFARQSGLRSTTLSERREAEARSDVSVFPLAFPLISGPGALTSVLLMAATAGGGWRYLGIIAVMAAVLGLVLAALLLAPRLMHLLGETGANVVSRVLGLILAALAVQYIIDGIAGAFGG